MNTEDTIEVSAPSVEEAIIIGLTRLAATRDEVVIEVVDEGNRGFLGIGNRTSRVRISRRSPEEPIAERPRMPSPPEVVDDIRTAAIADTAEEVTLSEEPSLVEEEPGQILESDDEEQFEDEWDDAEDDDEDENEDDYDSSGMTYSYMPAVEKAVQQIAVEMLGSIDVRIETEWREEERPTIWIDIRGKDADTMVGPRAQTLDSLQYLFRTLTHRLVDGDYNVVVDADGYRKRRRRSLETLARKQADKAVDTGRIVRLRAMPANERRVIHMTLRDDDRVETESYGTGRDRAVTIVPVRD